MGFAGYLQANTAVDVLIGPFVDETDGKTAETGLTLSQGDIKLSKNGQALAQKNDDTAAAHDANGYYNCELDATDTNTEGTLTLIVHKSGALPVRHDFMVLAQAAYISLVTAKDTGFMDVNVKAISEDTTAADNCELMFDGTGYAGGTTPLNVNVSSISNNAITAASIATGAIDADAIADNAIDAGAIATGAITAAKFASGAIDAAALAADAGSEIATAVWASATRTVTSAANITSTGGTVTLDGSGYVTYANAAPPTAAAIADAVWDESTTGHTTAGTFGAQCATDIDAILDDTGTSGVVVGSIANNAITAAAIATGAIDADALAADAGTEIGTAVWATTTRTLTAATNITSTGGTVTLDGSGYVTYANAAPPTAAAIADAVWDEATSGHTSAGTFGEQCATDIDAILTDTAEIGAAGAGLTAIPWNSSWDAEVQSEVFDALDAAFTDATGLTSNGLLDRIRTLGWILRNKIEVTDANGNTVIYKDDSTTAAFTVSSMLTDDSTTTTRLRAA